MEYDITSSPKLVKFKRKLNTGDSDDKILIEGDNIEMIHAFSWDYNSAIVPHLV